MLKLEKTELECINGGNCARRFRRERRRLSRSRRRLRHVRRALRRCERRSSIIDDSSFIL